MREKAPAIILTLAQESEESTYIQRKKGFPKKKKFSNTWDLDQILFGFIFEKPEKNSSFDQSWDSNKTWVFLDSLWWHLGCFESPVNSFMEQIHPKKHWLPLEVESRSAYRHSICSCVSAWNEIATECYSRHDLHTICLLCWDLMEVLQQLTLHPYHFNDASGVCDCLHAVKVICDSGMAWWFRCGG